jgi:hypothetical protein
MTTIFLPALFVAITAIVYCEVLMEDGMILSGWLRVLDSWPKWIAKPLGYCVYCFGGQLALWSGFFLFYSESFQIINHFLFIMVSIFFIHIYKIWNSNT